MSSETLPAYVRAEQPVFYNVGAWLKENEEYFQPPVCNKMMHNYQLKVGARLRESHFPIVQGDHGPSLSAD